MTTQKSSDIKQIIRGSEESRYKTEMSSGTVTTGEGTEYLWDRPVFPQGVMGTMWPDLCLFKRNYKSRLFVTFFYF